MAPTRSRMAVAAALTVSCASGFMRHLPTASRVTQPSKIQMVVSSPEKAADATDAFVPMRPPPEISYDALQAQLAENFGMSEATIANYNSIDTDALVSAYETMLHARQFENACNQAYMQGSIRGFMHLDNGQEGVTAVIADNLRKTDIKYSYYREHTHALASGVAGGAIMAELFGKVDGTCKGAGGSMHIYDKETFFQGGWALVAEQLPYAVGAARSILLDRQRDPEKFKDDDRIAIVFVGEGGAQNGRMAECLNAAAKEKLPILFLVIDNGRAINTFTGDVAANMNVFEQGKHYGVPGLRAEAQEVEDALRASRAVFDHVRTTGPAILQLHTCVAHRSSSPVSPSPRRPLIGGGVAYRVVSAAALHIGSWLTRAIERTLLHLKPLLALPSKMDAGKHPPFPIRGRRRAISAQARFSRARR